MRFRNLGIALAPAVILLAASACTPSGGDPGAGQSEQSGSAGADQGQSGPGEVRFDAPPDWQTLEEIFGSHTYQHDSQFDADEIAAAADTGTAVGELRFTCWCQVLARDLPAGMDLPALMAATYETVIIEEELAAGELSINGLPAYEREYMQFHGEPLWHVRDTWLEQAGRVYILRCKSSPNRFEQDRADFDLIRDSLQIVEEGTHG